MGNLNICSLNENARFGPKRQEYLIPFKALLCCLNAFVSFLLMTFPSLPLFALISFFFLAAAPSPAQEKMHWFKGNTHTHSLWSDGNDFPEMIAKFYKDNSYHFLVLSDHNILSRGEKWMNVGAIEKRRRTLGVATLKKYISTFGQDWVELRGEEKKQEVRLKTLKEIRPKFEKGGGFIFIEGEEITNSFGGSPVHTNGMNLKELIVPKKGTSLRDTMRNNIIAVREQSLRYKKPMLSHLNHPNFGWSITAEDLAHVLEEKFFEVYNGHPGINHLGDAKRPGDEKIWDIANTIRLATLKSDPLYGISSDDSHYYHGGDVKPGRGWVMVQSSSLEEDSIVRSMDSGNFYGSSGVHFKNLLRDQTKGTLEFEIEADASAEYVTKIIGTRKGNENKPDLVGETLATIKGKKVKYKLMDNEWYFRATVTSSTNHPLPSFSGQKEQAWTQPIWDSSVIRKK